MKVHLGAGFCEEDTGEYYVYTHSVAGHGVFYVGKGKGTRYTEMTERSKRHTEFSEGKTVIKEKVVENLNEDLALLLEWAVIQHYLTIDNGLVNYHVSSPCRAISDASKAKLSKINLGVNNPYHDKNLYEFVHKGGEEFFGTRVAFTEKYGFSPYVLFKPKSKLSYKTHNGWTLKGREFYNQEGENSRVSDKKQYLFRNDDGREFTGLRTAFSKEYGIQSKRLFGKRAMRVYFGWRVVECLDKD